MTSTSKGVAKLQKKGSSIGEVAKKNCEYGEGAKNPKKAQLFTQRDAALDLQVQRSRDNTSRRIVGAEHMGSTESTWNSPMLNFKVCYHRISD